MTDYDGPNISGVVDNSYVSALRMNLWASGQDNNTSLVRSQPIYLRIISLQWVQNESSYGVHEEKHKRYLLSHHMLGGHWRIHVSHLFRNFHRKKATLFHFCSLQYKANACTATEEWPWKHRPVPPLLTVLVLKGSCAAWTSHTQAVSITKDLVIKTAAACAGIFIAQFM